MSSVQYKKSSATPCETGEPSTSSVQNQASYWKGRKRKISKQVMLFLDQLLKYSIISPKCLYIIKKKIYIKWLSVNVRITYKSHSYTLFIDWGCLCTSDGGGGGGGGVTSAAGLAPVASWPACCGTWSVCSGSSWRPACAGGTAAAQSSPGGTGLNE